MIAELIALHMGGVPEAAMFLGPILLIIAFVRIARRNDAMASILGTGILMDRSEVTWDDAPLRERGIAPRSATDWITQEAARLRAG